MEMELDERTPLFKQLHRLFLNSAKLDRSLNLLTAAGGMVLPSTQQQLLSAVAFANGAQFLQNSALFSQAFTTNTKIMIMNEIFGDIAASMAATTSTGAPTGNGTHQQMSRVVHLRNIPSDMTDLELVHFCMPYGKLVNYLLLKGRNQAFVEYEDERSAQTLVAVSVACPVAIRDRTIFCQFSTHQELKTNRRPRVGNSGSNLINDQEDCNEVNLIREKSESGKEERSLSLKKLLVIVGGISLN
uniref:RRM domain-containing protein n=1 Tax=Setaria digitata TaxID=48799 RepID=A0A915Q0F2_9BILA